MSDTTFRPLEYVLGGSTLRVEYTDLTTLNVDVMVSSDDINLSMGGGVSEAILRAGGEDIWREARARAPIELGNIAVTTAGRLRAKGIFHAAVLDYSRRQLTNIDLIRRVTRKCLVICNEMGYQSIAFPALATGVARLSPERAAVAMLIETASYLAKPTDVKLVVIALYARQGLDHDVLPRFYTQVTDFLEITQRVENVSIALDNLERIYREVSLDHAANTAATSRDTLRRYRSSWEEEMLEREPSRRQGPPLHSYRDEIEPELNRISSLREDPGELEDLITRRSRPETWVTIEREYKVYRTQALQQMIVIRKMNVTDLEKELTIRGFAVEINRQLEREKAEIGRLENEVKELSKSQ